MTVRGLMEQVIFKVVNQGDGLNREITTPFCCDLLSIAMGRAPAGCAWVTVMGNMNTLAVAALTDAACVILAEGAVLDEVAKKKAADQEITVMSTDMPIFEAALKIYGLLGNDCPDGEAVACASSDDTPGAGDPRQ